MLFCCKQLCFGSLKKNVFKNLQLTSTKQHMRNKIYANVASVTYQRQAYRDV